MNTWQGRQALREWLDSKPDNFFESNRNLQYVLQMYLGEEKYRALQGSLSDLGRACATAIDEAAAINDRPENHPRLERYTSVGERIEEVEFHPSYHVAGRAAPRPARCSGRLACGRYDGTPRSAAR